MVHSQVDEGSKAKVKFMTIALHWSKPKNISVHSSLNCHGKIVVIFAFHHFQVIFIRKNVTEGTLMNILINLILVNGVIFYLNSNKIA